MSGIQDADIKSESELITLGADKTQLPNTTKVYTAKSDSVLETTLRKNDFSAVVNPAVTDDINLNYEVGSRWINTATGARFELIDNTAGAAVWVATGVGGGGGLDVFHAQDFEALTVSDFTKDRDPIYKTVGTGFNGALADEIATPISKKSTPKYTAGATSLNDWFDAESVDLDDKQKGETIGINFYADTSGFSVDAGFVVITNTGQILTDALDIIVASTDRTRYSFSVTIPLGATSISYGFHMVNAPVNGESFKFDDVEFSTNPFVFKNLLSEAELAFSEAGSTLLDRAGELRFSSALDDTDDTDIKGSLLFKIEDDSGNTRTKIIAQRSLTMTVSLSGAVAATNGRLAIYRNGSVEQVSGQEDANEFGHVTWTGTLSTGDFITVGSDVGQSIANDASLVRLNISAIAEVVKSYFNP